MEKLNKELEITQDALFQIVLLSEICKDKYIKKAINEVYEDYLETLKAENF